MTDPAYRHLIVVVDRSGSMQTCREGTQEGINALFAEQAKGDGRATASLYQFDTDHDTVFAHTPLDKAPAYELVPRGGTALLDAVGFAFTREGEWLASLPEDQRPGQVVAVIATDGQENSSHEYTAPQIRRMIETQREAYAWEVLFIGANMDAVKTAASYGIPQAQSMTFAATNTGTADTYRSVSAYVTRSGLGDKSGFTDAERASATGS